MKTEPTLMLEVILNSTNSSHWINSKYLHHSMDDIKEITGDHYIIGKEEMDEIANPLSQRPPNLFLQFKKYIRTYTLFTNKHKAYVWGDLATQGGFVYLRR
jgi:hypothetical protein